MTQPARITRTTINMDQFRVQHGPPKKQPNRDQFMVKLSYGGLVGDDEKPIIKLNRAVWRTILRALKLDPTTAYFEREDVKMVYKQLLRTEPPFKDDPEAVDLFGKVVQHFSKGRAVSVISEQWSN